MLKLEGVRMAADRGGLAADLAIAPARRVAVLGPSGAGKSTLLDVIAGFLTPLSGGVHWAGGDLTALGPDARPVSILFQDSNLFPHLDLTRNLGLALYPDGRRPDAETRERIAGALYRVGLAGMEARKPGNLSGGQQSRAALARVLLMARPILLLDEPFAALGPGLKREMLGVVRDVADSLGALTLLVTHDPEDARQFAQEVVLVSDGIASPPVPVGAFFEVPPKAYLTYMGRSG